MNRFDRRKYLTKVTCLYRDRGDTLLMITLNNIHSKYLQKSVQSFIALIIMPKCWNARKVYTENGIFIICRPYLHANILSQNELHNKLKRKYACNSKQH